MGNNPYANVMLKVIFHLKKSLIYCAGPIWRLISWAIPKDFKNIAINSFPDFDDATRAIVMALKGSNKRLIVLTTKKKVSLPSWLDGISVLFAYRYSLKGVWLYHRSKYIFFTHGCFSAWKPTKCQVVVNIWHGMPIKRIGLLDGHCRKDIAQFHYTIASDVRFQTIISNAFGVNSEKVLISNHPRIDILQDRTGLSKLSLKPHNSLAVWLPTYRAAVKGDIRVDGDTESDIFSDSCDLTRIDKVLTTKKCICIVKPHPMSNAKREIFSRYKSLVFLDDNDLTNIEVSLYQVLAVSDFLITDVSSVYFDYKSLGRPVLVYCPDFDNYASSRGFVAPIEQLIDEKIISSENELIEKIDVLLSKKGLYAVAPHEPIQSRSITKELFRMLGIC